MEKEGLVTPLGILAIVERLRRGSVAMRESATRVPHGEESLRI